MHQRYLSCLLETLALKRFWIKLHLRVGVSLFWVISCNIVLPLSYITLRVSWELQTPSAASRAFPLRPARPPPYCSTSVSCWTRASSTSLSPWSSAGRFSSREESSFWRSGWRKIRYLRSPSLYSLTGRNPSWSACLFTRPACFPGSRDNSCYARNLWRVLWKMYFWVFQSCSCNQE